MAINSVSTMINGQSYTLTLNNSTGKYESTITAPSLSSYNQSGHYYGVKLLATDTAGNQSTIDASDATLGSKLKLVVKETVAPIVTITYPTASATIVNNAPSIAFTVSDVDAGVNPDTIKITIDGTAITTGITKTLSSHTYTCSYSPSSALADGEHTISVNASDYDGNAAITKSVTFKIDTVPPALSITSPTETLITNVASLVVTGITNDVTSSPCAVTVNGASASVNSDGSFSKSITLSEGANTITVVSTDSAGKSTTITRHVTLDTVLPVISAVSITPNPVNAGSTFLISVTVSD